MNKFDILVKKAEAFYKLAVYSDRKTFLQSLSQDNTLQTLFNQAAKLINDNGGNISDLSAMFNHDPAQLANVIEESAAKIPMSLGNPNIKLQINNIVTKIRSLSNPTTTDVPVANKPKQTTNAPNYPQIDTEVQEMLSKYVSENGLGIPLNKIDGKLGPDTRAAINALKKSLNHPEMSDQEAFNWLSTFKLTQNLNS